MNAKQLSLLSLAELSQRSGRSTQQRFDQYNQATKNTPAPFGILDWAALSANTWDILERANGVPVRIATKSLRVPGVLQALLQRSEFSGLMSFTVPEAIHLVRSGISDDVLVAYPSTNVPALRQLIDDPDLRRCITLMVDHPGQLGMLTEFADSATLQEPVRVCLDIDCSLKLPGGVHLGARRSPIHSVSQAEAVAGHIAGLRGIQLVGIMGYEAQIAGVTDSSPAVRGMKKFSNRELIRRRSAIVAAVEAVLRNAGARPLEFVNGGGTGSIETTIQDTSVTEVAAGSGFFGPHLFDHYDSFTPSPAAFFALDVVRHPTDNMVTAHGGGWIASGTPGKDRLPQPVWPEGLGYVGSEAAGEVQTPLTCSGPRPEIGERIWMRHTKAGELSEHLNKLLILDGTTVVAELPTYRGQGHAFI